MVGLIYFTSLVNESLSSTILPKLIGTGLAKELVFTGLVFSGKDAPAGLFNHVVPEAEVLPKGEELVYYFAGDCARNPSNYYEMSFDNFFS